MEMAEIMPSLVTGFMAAVGSSLLTVAGIRVHIHYLQKADERHEAEIARAHKRIDEVEGK